MQELLETCRQNFGSAPRRFSFWERMTYLRVPKPSWLKLKRSDELTTLFDHCETTFQNGRVVWGFVIQANSLMFQPGKVNCPGEMVYSLEDSYDPDPFDLQTIAKTLFDLKGTTPEDPELSPIADYLTDERIRVFGLKVPEWIARTLPCKISTTFFVRKHIPGGMIQKPLFPLIVNPQTPHVVLPLPEKFWPADLKKWWLGESSR